VIVVGALSLVCASPVLAQYHERALERAREVKMLTDGRGEVRKAFYDFNLSSSDETSDGFSFGDTEIGVTYSTGGCGEEDSEEIWNVPIGKVIGIKIVDNHEWKRDAHKLDLSKLEKEHRYAGNETDFVFSDKKAGVAIEIDDDEVEGVMLFPPVNSKAKTCKNDFARDFINEKSWFGKVKLEDRGIISCSPPPSVAQLELGHSEISALTRKQVDVKATAVNPDNDILTYNYTVTGGRIIGAGAKVKWDLTGVRSGTYTITRESMMVVDCAERR
jgi:hypothetical protein